MLEWDDPKVGASVAMAGHDDFVGVVYFDAVFVEECSASVVT